MDSNLKNEFKKTNEWMSYDVLSFRNMTGKQSKLIGLFVIAMMLLNFPLLGIFTHSSSIRGIPTVYIYLFIVWLAIILIMRQNVESRKMKDKKDKNNPNDK